MLGNLYLDGGNHALKWGIYGHDRWLTTGRVVWSELAQWRVPMPCRRHVYAACVAGGMRARAVAEHLTDYRCRWLSAKAHALGVVSAYQTCPEDLGVDRWAALVAAHQRYAGRKLIVLAGTATCLDVLEADGRHVGGLILPGLHLMRQSLHDRTARLPDVIVKQSSSLQVGATTEQCIAVGTLFATLKPAQALAAAYDCQHVLVSGGGSEVFVRHWPNVQADHYLVLEGVRQLATLDP